MQLSSFDRYLPCNSHHIHEPEPPQQQQQQPRSSRINIQRAPQVHIQRTVPNSVRFANFLSNHLQSQVNHIRSTSAPTATSTPPPQPQPSAQSNASVLHSCLNDAQLNTPIPIFGSNQIQLQIRDFVNVSPTPTTFNRIRVDLREFIMLKLSLTSNPSDENVELVIIIYKFQFGLQL